MATIKQERKMIGIARYLGCNKGEFVSEVSKLVDLAIEEWKNDNVLKFESRSIVSFEEASMSKRPVIDIAKRRMFNDLADVLIEDKEKSALRITEDPLMSGHAINIRLLIVRQDHEEKRP